MIRNYVHSLTVSNQTYSFGELALCPIFSLLLTCKQTVDVLRTCD